jgi:quercetin dioxygenase-like cupin family protein
MTQDRTVRRVITAQSREGRSVVAIDEQVESIIADGSASALGQQLWQIWGADSIPQLPTDGTAGYANTLFAPPGGFRVQICEFPAESGTSLVPRGEWPQLGTVLRRPETGKVRTAGSDGKMGTMHHTNSVDIILVLEGEIGFRLDDGVEVLLSAGDVLVNNGVAHAWRRGEKPCRICMVAQGAERD